jgi:hypothetical protein
MTLDERFWFLRNRRVLVTGYTGLSTVVAAVATTWLSWPQLSLAVYLAGFIAGLALCTCGLAFAAWEAELRLRSSMEVVREAAEVIAESVSDELRRRGDEFEAVVTPRGVTIHRRDRDPHERLH